jgi:hypothetical protein
MENIDKQQNSESAKNLALKSLLSLALLVSSVSIKTPNAEAVQNPINPNQTQNNLLLNPETNQVLPQQIHARDDQTEDCLRTGTCKD